MKEILEAVMRRLKEQVPDLAYVSEDWGQMDYYNEAPPVKFPCALISVSHIGFESETWGVRRARLPFLIRIADCPVLTGNMAAPEQHRSRALAIFDLMEQVGNCLYGFGTDAFNDIEQQEVTRYNREDAIREYAMTFTTGYAVESEEG